MLAVALEGLADKKGNETTMMKEAVILKAEAESLIAADPSFKELNLTNEAQWNKLVQYEFR